MTANSGFSPAEFPSKPTLFTGASAPAVRQSDRPAPVPPQTFTANPPVPDYLRDTYSWAYLNPGAVRFFDHEWVVSIILWGQHRRLQRAAFKEIKPGSRVLQPAAVYGNFSANLGAHVGPSGSLTVTDVAPIQVARCRARLAGFPHVTVRRADARQPGGLYDAVCCYFLMHELPDNAKREAIDSLLGKIGTGGKAIFVDYHKPHPAHPLKPVTSVIFDTLEPYAKSVWRHELSDFASAPHLYEWHKTTFFGGMFQLVTATRKPG